MEENLKQLLLKDICARLPYGVKVAYLAWSREKGNYIVPMRIYSLNTDGYMRLIGQVDEGGGQVEITKYLPYLRPMDSMTEEEREEYIKECNKVLLMRYRASSHYQVTDWLNEHHFDFRSLIEKGLALEAPADMYKTE